MSEHAHSMLAVTRVVAYPQEWAKLAVVGSAMKYAGLFSVGRDWVAVRSCELE